MMGRIGKRYILKTIIWSCQEFQIFPKEDTNLLNSFKTDKSLHFISEKLIFKEW